MKSISIYKTRDSFKIVTMYRLESWSYISSEPIYILELDSDIALLGNVIFQSLENSR